MDLGANDPHLQAAVEEALARGRDHAGVELPPPALIITGLAVEVGPFLFAGQQAVGLTIKNHVAHATMPMSLDAVDQLIGQLQAAKAQALGLHVNGGLVTP